MHTATGLFAIWGDRSAGHECFLAARAEAEHDVDNVAKRKEGESSKKVQPQGEYESFTVDVDHLDRQGMRKMLLAYVKSIV